MSLNIINKTYKDTLRHLYEYLSFTGSGKKTKTVGMRLI